MVLASIEEVVDVGIPSGVDKFRKLSGFDKFLKMNFQHTHGKSGINILASSQPMLNGSVSNEMVLTIAEEVVDVAKPSGVDKFRKPSGVFLLTL